MQQTLESRGDELHIIEIAGAGSPYAFADNNPLPSGPVKNWTCLFPTARMEDISPARACKYLLAKLNELSPDLVMAGSIAFPSGAAAVCWAKTKRRAVVIFDDAKPHHTPRNGFVNYIKRLIFRQVDAVLCPADPWTEAFRHWGFREEQLFFGVDVVDNKFWHTRDTTAAPPLPSPYLLAVGRQIPVKNFCGLLIAYNIYLSATLPHQRLPLLLIGEGPERPRIENLIESMSLHQYVYLLPFTDQEALRTIYQHAAALIMPSLSETWGLVANEAMAAGLPILLSDTCGCASVLVQNSINGYTFPPDRPDRIMETLCSFSRLTPVEKAAMGTASRNLIRPWGLDRFARGSLQAIDYAIIHKKRCTSIPARLAIQHWKGRYRPI